MKISYILGLTAIMFILTACQPSKSKANDTTSKTEMVEEQSEDNPNVISFTQNDMDNIPVDATDEFAKHKITIIDFWASWCPPCRREMPNLVNVYNNYKDKGLGIIGVSLDEDKEQWTDAVKGMNMTWTQVSDLQGWDNQVAVKYGVRSIPYTMIVDSKGKLIAKELRGEELETFVARYFQN
ncbi:MAG: TlpA family protein disulfide reductase [Prevotella sp.]|nr:TlpA family protein disulfide reductase [Prevotella sp.]